MGSDEERDERWFGGKESGERERKGGREEEREEGMERKRDDNWVTRHSKVRELDSI